MSVFSKIINKEIPAFIVAENDLFVAFMDIAPLVRGHVLVVPKTETDKLFELPDNILEQILVFAKPISKAIEMAFDCKRCGISVVGLEVAHAHMHLVPINSADDLNFTRQKLTLSNDEISADHQKLVSCLG